MFKYFVGIDISKDNFNVAILDLQQNVILELKMEQKYDDYERLVTILIGMAEKEEIAIGIESSGNYHMNLLIFLLENGFRNTVLINPFLIHNFYKSLTLRRTKTDRIDARVIGQFMVKNPERIEGYRVWDTVKVIAREREELAKEVAKLKVQVKDMVFSIFKELGDRVNVLTKSMLEFLMEVPSARVAREKGVEGLREVIERIRRGPGRRINLSAEEVLAMANRTISIENEGMEEVLISKVRRLLILEGELEYLTGRLIEAVRERQGEGMRIMGTIPGVGELSAAIFLAEVGGIERFGWSYKKVVAYAGLDPVIHESGRYKGRFKISRRGNPHLRRIIWNMAVNAIFFNEEFKNYFRRKREEGKSYKEAVIATSNKLIRIIVYLLKTGMSYEGERSLTRQIIHSCLPPRFAWGEARWGEFSNKPAGFLTDFWGLGLLTCGELVYARLTPVFHPLYPPLSCQASKPERRRRVNI